LLVFLLSVLTFCPCVSLSLALSPPTQPRPRRTGGMTSEYIGHTFPHSHFFLSNVTHFSGNEGGKYSSCFSFSLFAPSHPSKKKEKGMSNITVRPQLFHDGQVYCDFIYQTTQCADEDFHQTFLLVCIPVSLVTFVLCSLYLIHKIVFKVSKPFNDLSHPPSPSEAAFDIWTLKLLCQMRCCVFFCS